MIAVMASSIQTVLHFCLTGSSVYSYMLLYTSISFICDADFLSLISTALVYDCYLTVVMLVQLILQVVCMCFLVMRVAKRELIYVIYGIGLQKFVQYFHVFGYSVILVLKT